MTLYSVQNYFPAYSGGGSKCIGLSPLLSPSFHQKCTQLLHQVKRYVPQTQTNKQKDATKLIISPALPSVNTVKYYIVSKYNAIFADNLILDHIKTILFSSKGLI